jgi:hypothetical protein
MFKPAHEVRPDDRREHARSPAQGRLKLIPGSIVAPRGPAFEVELVDRSMTGLRVRLDRDANVSGDVVLLSASTGQAYEARVVWKTSPHVGLQLRRTVDVRSATGAESAALRKLWRESFS